MLNFISLSFSSSPACKADVNFQERLFHCILKLNFTLFVSIKNMGERGAATYRLSSKGSVRAGVCSPWSWKDFFDQDSGNIELFTLFIRLQSFSLKHT